MKYAAAIVFGLFVILPTQAIAAPELPPLTAAEVTLLLSGNSMAGNGKIKAPAEPYDWIAFYAVDGTITIRLKPEWGGAEDSGKWWVTQDGEVCRHFPKMGADKEGCWLFHHEAEFYRFVPSRGHAYEGIGVVIQGNLLEKAN